MAVIGEATLNIVPKFTNLEGTINSALKGANTTSGTKALGNSVNQGITSALAPSGAAIGAFSAIASGAMGAVSSSVSSAVSRLDTLKNYPQVMEALGVSSDEAQSSIQTMSDRLSSLPTTLDSMSSTVQGLYAATKDYGVSLTTATDAGLALNDMLLSGGQGTAVVNSAMEQFRQMLTKGKPDMQDWKSLLSAAPGQMDQLAKSMLGATATTKDLYYALGGGLASDDHMEGIEFASISMDELLDSIIRLDKEGGAGLAGFKQQAEEATGGIGTAMANLQNAFSKGLANVFDSFGRDNITKVLGGIKGTVTDVFKGFATAAETAAPAIMTIVDAIGGLAPLLPTIIGVGTAIKVLSTGFGALKTGAGLLSGAAGSASSALRDLALKTGGDLQFSLAMGSGALQSFSEFLAGPWGIAIAAGTTALTVLVGAALDMQAAHEAARDAVVDFDAAVSSTAALDGYKASLDDFGQTASQARDYLADMTSSWQAHADTMAKNTQDAQETIGKWQAVQSILDDLIGKEQLTTEEQGRLNWALEQYNEATGESVSANDALQGSYTDTEGNVQDLKAAVDDLAQAYINEARMAALSHNLTEAYEAQSEAAGQLATVQGAYNDAYDEAMSKIERGIIKTGSFTAAEVAHAEALSSLSQKTIEVDGETRLMSDVFTEAQDHVESANAAVDQLEEQLGTMAEASSGAATEYDKFAASNVLMQAAMEQSKYSASDLMDGMEKLGIDTSTLADLQMDSWTRIASTFDGSTESIVEGLKACGTETDAAVASITNLNATPIEDKYGTVNVDSDSVETGINRGVTFNNMPLNPKHGTATVDSDSVQTATTRGITFNGTALASHHGSSNVDGNIQWGIDKQGEFNAMPESHKYNSITTEFKNITKNVVQYVTEGSRAKGGVRKHAGGAVFTKPTMIDSYNMIGEDGAEYYDGDNIVPLTSRHAQPFADIVAEGVNRRLGNNSPQITANFYVTAGNDPELFARKSMRSMAQLARAEGR